MPLGGVLRAICLFSFGKPAQAIEMRCWQESVHVPFVAKTGIIVR